MARSAVPKIFWARLQCEFGEQLTTQNLNNMRENSGCVDDFWQ